MSGSNQKGKWLLVYSQRQVSMNRGYMLKEIEDWIHSMNLKHFNQRKSCSRFAESFSGYYSKEFLDTAWFVVVDEIPKPLFLRGRNSSIDKFLGEDLEGITYNDTYYIHSSRVNDLRLHFHELVHVAQWRMLGVMPFIERYIEEISRFDYEGAPLEIMAYSLDEDFFSGRMVEDVPGFVRSELCL